VCIYIYIYIYRERKRESEWEWERSWWGLQGHSQKFILSFAQREKSWLVLSILLAWTAGKMEIEDSRGKGTSISFLSEQWKIHWDGWTGTRVFVEKCMEIRQKLGEDFDADMARWKWLVCLIRRSLLVRPSLSGSPKPSKETFVVIGIIYVQTILLVNQTTTSSNWAIYDHL
jgi:hypothetical protein